MESEIIGGKLWRQGAEREAAKLQPRTPSL
jgi:hypothetical protein